MGEQLDPTIGGVVRGSPADRAGIEAGDRLVSVEGKRPRDAIDYLLLTDGCQIELAVRRRRDGGDAFRVVIAKAEGEPLGLRFSQAVFDGLRRCSNRCIFCFIDQLPRGLRKSLYLKDDDYRLSFLDGNFITLTNLEADDVDRIIEQRISPLYVSLHATDPERRKVLLRPRGADRAMKILRRLLDAHIEIHVQIVVCPGLNNGSVLDATLGDLDRGYGEVSSIGLVPVGLTKHRQDLPVLRRFSEREAAELITEVGAQQARFERVRGTPWVFLADEFYLLAGAFLPGADHYQDFAQLENGIGIARRFLDDAGRALGEVKSALKRTGRALGQVRSTLEGTGGSLGEIKPALGGTERADQIAAVTGALAASIVGEVIRRARETARGLGIDLSARAVAVENALLGDSITVAGLMSGSDIARALNGRGFSRILVPSVAVNGDGVFLDDTTPEQLAGLLDAPVEVIPASGRGLVSALFAPMGAAPRIPVARSEA